MGIGLLATQGPATAPAHSPQGATATHHAVASRTLTLQGTAPVSARYLLAWFTQLARDGAGTYQVGVSNVSVSGTA